MRHATLIVSLVGLFVSTPALAQDASGDQREIRYKQREEIDFDVVDVTGELVKPQGQLLLERRKASFNPLIKLRADFNEEMRKSIDQIK